MWAEANDNAQQSICSGTADADARGTSGEASTARAAAWLLRGVDRAVEAVERALERHGAPVYVRNEIVHNQHVVATFRERGVVFVNDTDEVPPGAVMMFSAHGVSPAVRVAAKERGLQVIDATCPLVTKVHNEVNRFARRNYEILLVGHEGHEEVEGPGGRPQTMYRWWTEPTQSTTLWCVTSPSWCGCRRPR